MGIDWKIHFFDSTGFKYLNELTNCFCDTVTHSERQESHLVAKEDDDTNVDDDPKKHTKNERERVHKTRWKRPPPRHFHSSRLAHSPDQTTQGLCYSCCCCCCSQPKCPFLRIYISLSFLFLDFIYFFFYFHFLFSSSFFHSSILSRFQTWIRPEATQQHRLLLSILYPRCLE